MAMKNSQRGEVITLVVVVLAIIAGGLFAWKPKFLHGDTKRAKQSAAATAAVERSTAKVETVIDKQGAIAAASLVKIGEAAASAPASPERDFQMREVPLALSYLPKPDPASLLAAEQRKVAVMEGRLAEANRLYGKAEEERTALARSLAAAIGERDKARAQRASVDAELAEVAAARRSAEQQRAILIIVVVLLGLGWGYAKIFGISTGTLGKWSAAVRGGTPPIEAMDDLLTPWQKSRAYRAAQLATDLDKNGNGIPDALEKPAAPPTS